MAKGRAWKRRWRTTRRTRLVKALFDSTVLIAHLRGDHRARDLLLSVPHADRCISVLTRVEIEGGMRSAERSQVAALLSTMRKLPVSDAVARRTAIHLRRFRRSHVGIDIVDYAIAATAELHNARLLTLNLKHFPMFPELQEPW